MRKRLIAPLRSNPGHTDSDWLNLEAVALVEFTSEASDHPIESALTSGAASGWRASEPGKQTIRLLFDEPQQIRRIMLEFLETNAERTQEIVLRWSPGEGKSFREIVRQQWNFHPTHSSCEVEDYQVDLPAVTILELDITPDISGGSVEASLAKLRLA